MPPRAPRFIRVNGKPYAAAVVRVVASDSKRHPRLLQVIAAEDEAFELRGDDDYLLLYMPLLVPS